MTALAAFKRAIRPLALVALTGGVAQAFDNTPVNQATLNGYLMGIDDILESYYSPATFLNTPINGPNATMTSTESEAHIEATTCVKKYMPIMAQNNGYNVNSPDYTATQKAWIRGEMARQASIVCVDDFFRRYKIGTYAPH